MKKIYSYEIYLRISESIDDIMSKVSGNDAEEIKTLVNQQDEIFQKYDLPEHEINNIKSSIEDTIKMKFGI